MRKREIQLLFLPLMISVCALAQPVTRSLTILHTNDLHAHLLPDAKNLGGFAQLATVIRRETAGCSSCLVLNAGDLVQGTPVSTLYHGDPVYQIANHLGIHASTLGNHEFDYGWQHILKFVHLAAFPTVSANLVDKDEKLLARPYVIRKINGIRIGIIGVIMGDLISNYLAPGTEGPWRALPVVETVRKYADEISDRTDLIVVLGHIEDAERSALLQQVPKVAVVVMGHNHQGLMKAEAVDGRVGVECKSYGVELGRLDMQVDLARKSLASWEWKKIVVDAGTVTAAPDVKKLVEGWEAKVSKIVDVPIGEAARDFTVDDVKLLIERAMAEVMHADFGYMNRGGVRDPLPKGKLLARAVWNIMPFENRMVTGKFKGSQLSPALTGGRAVDPDREYIVAMADFSARNESERKLLGITELHFNPSTILLRDLLIDWIKNKRIVD